jgi:GTP-binding protein
MMNRASNEVRATPMIRRKRRKPAIVAALVWMAAAHVRPDFVASLSAPAMILHGARRESAVGRRILPLMSSPADTDDLTTRIKSSASGGGDDFSFFDEASIYVRAGSGGQGSSTYKKAKKSQNGIPDGGAGGTGGNIVLQLDSSLNTLAGLSRRALRPNAFGGGGGAASSKRSGHKFTQERLLSFRAQDGRPGGRMYDNGRCGEDCLVRVPPGTVVSYEMVRQEEKDEGEPGEIIDESTEDDDDNDQEEEESTDEEDDDDQEEEDVGVEYDLQEVGTLSFDEPMLQVARGGAGGDGTASHKGKKGKKRAGPIGGERFRLRLTLKMVADVALVGVPNAGKSTFLASVTKAEPKIADYPFTTVVPNLGVWIPGTTTTTTDWSSESQQGKGGAVGSTGVVLCDVPGLIAGAADGVGLGHAFLRHVERCRVILHLVDATSEDPIGDYCMVNEEIRRYGNGKLAEMPQVVVVNKIDAWEQETENELREELEEKLKSTMPHSRLMWMSAKEKDGVDDLMRRMSAYVEMVKETQLVEAGNTSQES